MGNAASCALLQVSLCKLDFLYDERPDHFVSACGFRQMKRQY